MPHRARRVLTAASLLGLVLAQQACASTDTGPVTGGSSSPAPSAPAAPSTEPATSAPPATGDVDLPDEDTQVLVHIADVDKDWSATYEGPITTGDGTGQEALFRLRPASGGAYQIQALRFREEGGEWCAVAYDEPDAADRLTTKECGENKFTLFTIAPTGKADEKDRPTFTITNAELGAITYDEKNPDLLLSKTGTTTFSFVDKGEAELQGQ